MSGTQDRKENALARHELEAQAEALRKLLSNQQQQGCRSFLPLRTHAVAGC